MHQNKPPPMCARSLCGSVPASPGLCHGGSGGPRGETDQLHLRSFGLWGSTHTATASLPWSRDSSALEGLTESFCKSQQYKRVHNHPNNGRKR